ncbi:AMP-dependent synthetase/ligase [Actimicrobium antarcticum]|uniref:AMP-dependent synthetase/ligase n=1 Tax=Actimicrobium antarcticum TaxID=1051899 RepID=A0ABP7SV04_9BURK
MNDIPNYTLTQAQMLRLHAQRRPDALAIRQKKFGIWQPVSWAAYYRRACHVGLGFRALGLGPGAHIAILSENRIEWVLSQLGAGLVGAITVGVYSTSPSNEIAYVLNHADAEVIICEDQEQADKVLAVIDQLPLLKKIIVLEKKGFEETRVLDLQRVMSFRALEEAGVQHGQLHPRLVDTCLDAQQLDDTALLIYTSGSTGKPKGAMISYANIAAMAEGAAERLNLNNRTTHLSYLPLCHVAEQMLTAFVPLYLGSRVDFGESIRTVQEDLREVGPSMFLGVPRIWEKLHSAISIKMHESGAIRRWLFATGMRTCAPFAEKAAHQRNPMQQLAFSIYYLLIFRALQNFIGLRRAKIALTGAAPISPVIVQFFRTLGVPLVEVYGMTESSGMVLGQRLDDVYIGRVGLPIIGVEHRLSAQGELQIRGAVVFQGYYKNPEATASTIIDGWLHTGDVVSAGEGGLKIVDRLKDIMITAGGKNLTPSEIENTMKSSHFIKECIVIADARKYVAALIQIDYDAVAQWAEARNMAFTHYRSLIDAPEVRDLVQAEIDIGNARLAQVSQIRKFHLLTKELDHDDGEVTATMKVRRSSITRTYAGDIDAMYR